MNWLTVLFVLGGMASPWLLTWLPWVARACCVMILAVAGCWTWCRGVRRTRRKPLLLLFGSDLVSVSVAAGWIAVASYSAQLSKAGVCLLYAAVSAAIMAPALVSLVLIRGRQGRRFQEGLLLILPLLLTASVFLARPARRFRREDRGAVRPVAESLEGAREAMQWVAANIRYERGPFTDTARDTLERGHAHCGGQANVLHKILAANGVRSRIVHLEGESRIHTLVEYVDEGTGRWVLADPTHDLMGIDHGALNATALLEMDGAVLPRKWRGFSRLYLYDPMNGYTRVAPDNRREFYPEGGQ
ncbi:MAG: transglutaminase domain-containing protein [Lentisphaerae bacterium]|nr:transglutaminase domain-containing protein [Lentisphaerota bacterium]